MSSEIGVSIEPETTEDLSNLVNVDKVKQFLLQVLAPMLEISESILSASLFSASSSMVLVKKFISDSSFQVLYVLKASIADSKDFTFSVHADLSNQDSHVMWVAVLKRVSILESTSPLSSQVQFLNFPSFYGNGEGSNVYQTLHSFIHNAVSPFYNAYLNSKQKNLDKDDKDTRMVAKKKIAELELSLLNLQQNVEIPEVHLVINPVILKTIEKCSTSNKKITVEEVGDQINDSSFLNRLQSDVNNWIKEVQKLTRLTRESSCASASQEVNFWLNMEYELGKTDSLLKGAPISLTLDVLKSAKRFMATVSFVADTGIKEAIEIVQKYNVLMKDLPLSELLSAPSLEKVRDSVALIFGHVNKKLKLSPYPVSRALTLMDCISSDLNEKLIQILMQKKLMHLEYEQLERMLEVCDDVFAVWDDNSREFVNVARDVSRKRSEKFIPIKLNPVHIQLQDRLKYLASFRKQHFELRNTLVKIVGTEGLSNLNAIEEIDAAYDTVRSVDILDLSTDGTEIWAVSEASYNDKISKVENQIIDVLRELLSNAKTAGEMFRVFSKFNLLFIRPKIRGAIQEYQTQLIENVKSDIQKLQNQFKKQYHGSEAAQISQMKDIPPVAGAIIWVRQIEKQLMTYMKRVEDVLGKGWELYADGKKLAAESSTFKSKLDSRPIFDNWLSQTADSGISVSGALFVITRDKSTNMLTLQVNFDDSLIKLFKEVRSLQSLGLHIPHALMAISKEIRKVFPYSISLTESLLLHQSALNLLKHREDDIGLLISKAQEELHAIFKKGLSMRWENFSQLISAEAELEYSSFVSEFSESIALFKNKVETLTEVYEEISVSLDNLSGCQYGYENFTSSLDMIQASVDKLSLGSYSNLEEWVSLLNSKIEGILLARLQDAVFEWKKHFEKESVEDELNQVRLRIARFNSVSSDNEILASPTNLYPVQISKFVHKIVIKNQIMQLVPSLSEAESLWLRSLHSWICEVALLKKIKSSRYDLNSNVNSVKSFDSQLNYQDLVRKLPASVFKSLFTSIKEKTERVGTYVNNWLQYQALWDVEPVVVYSYLETDVKLWNQCVSEITEERATIDNSDNFKSFGVLEVDYRQVQAKVNAKYDFWQKDLVNRFGEILLASLKTFHSELSKSRAALEKNASVDVATTRDAVAVITLVEDLKKKSVGWKSLLENFRASYKTLEKQRYNYPQEWIYIDSIESAWNSFVTIFEKVNNIVQQQIATLRAQVLHEGKLVEQRVSDSLSQWEKEKPIQGNLKAEDALQALGNFEVKLTHLKDEKDSLNRAKEALLVEVVSKENLSYALEELQDLKSVWSSLLQVYKSLNEISETPWASVIPRKIRQQLDSLLNIMKEMPSRTRQYAAYEHLQDVLKSHIKSNLLLVELKSDALKDRHWKSLLKMFKFDSHFNLNQMSLGLLWDVNLIKNEVLIRDILTVAQGEMALEEFLRLVKDTWQNYAIELIPYQNKTRLIKGWDFIFEKCGEHLSSLSAMKHSPYFRVFEEEALAWEDKLNRIHILFDSWIDVQRQWVYLEGIFMTSADIKHLLPMEHSRFQGINAEFLAVMKKVQKASFILEVIALPNIQKTLERLADLLNKIQKALGDYLEKERSQFPRFYFVGDEDLLEIIGNSKEVTRIQKHFRKMFAGISQVILNQDGSLIIGMASREGEILKFPKPIQFGEGIRINEWLSELENLMKLSLAEILGESLSALKRIYGVKNMDFESFLTWIESVPSQISCLAVQICWTSFVEENIKSSSLEKVLDLIETTLEVLAEHVLKELSPTNRKKCEHIISELVHERSVVRILQSKQVKSPDDFNWLYFMRFYYNDAVSSVLDSVEIKMADASFSYGFEYLGVPERLVQTPLTDKCYLTLTQALQYKFGGSPFGPAGTGKTESVKFLGVLLGRFVLVFCCDENFDFQAMGRIFVGLCQVGAWGCFDEFNRLREEISSAVSQQIQSIQEGLRTVVSSKRKVEIDLLSRSIALNEDSAIFITMNPGYAGRQNLPDNLKRLFRPISMIKPDKEMIAQVMLFSQGFKCAEKLSSKIVPFFNLCLEQLSDQSHYDFGLRALKSVLISAGNIKRVYVPGTDELNEVSEQLILIRSIQETVVPKLVGHDIQLLHSLTKDFFPSINYSHVIDDKLIQHVKQVCQDRNLMPETKWLEKIAQIFLIQQIHHGFMLVGSSSGKSTAWTTLLTAMEQYDGVEGVSYVIDPKAVSKDLLYGRLDSTTREWTDGLLTQILRKIIDNIRGEASKRHWIVFDGDVDPEWVENLNSVLDDNKLLTLPNGERLALPDNVRLVFEVENLKYATLATVSRCGMVWFSEDTIDFTMISKSWLLSLGKNPIDSDLAMEYQSSMASVSTFNEECSQLLTLQRSCVEIFEPYFNKDGIVHKALDHCCNVSHIMEFSSIRAISTLLSLLKKSIIGIIHYNISHSDFPMSYDSMQAFLLKKLLHSICWSFVGDSPLEIRKGVTSFLRGITTIPLPPDGSIIDFDVDSASAEWVPYSQKVPRMEIETHMVVQSDLVIPTVDTIRHEDVLYSWLSEHHPVILCGPPGSGKTMSLFSSLRKLPDTDVVGINFSSATSPDLLLKTLEQHCEYRKIPSGTVLSPVNSGKWLILFCDEINLPELDKYGTQTVISLIRQLIEHKGFYRPKDRQWVSLERIQFVGACNPPTDPGRVPLPHRFLRHVSVVMVDYPGFDSLKQIYGTFNRALLKLVPALRAYADPITDAMVSFHTQSQRKFTADLQAHYIYSPRELTRWVRGLYEAIKPVDSLSVEQLVRIWAHEALRLYQDRLVLQNEREWTDELVGTVAMEHFPTINHDEALKTPILFSNWLNKCYVSVDREVLREFVRARLKVFCEEEVDVHLVLFNDVLDHVLRIDRVFHQSQGHLLLIGISGCGKTTLARFVSWMNGFSVFQIQAHRNYTGEDFDNDLKSILKRCGAKGEKICFILDESNLLDSGFLERMNTLLANGEIPGLFEGDEFTALMALCKETASKDGFMLDNFEEIYKWFTNQITKNLHVVFTMNPPENGFGNRAATSPALFNRCVLDWFGDWSSHAFYNVANEFLLQLDVDDPTYVSPKAIPNACIDLPKSPSYRDNINNSFVYVHQTVFDLNQKYAKRFGRSNYNTPRNYLDFIGHYCSIFNKKREELEDQQRHVNQGLDRLNESVAFVEQMRIELAKKKIDLEKKSNEANEKLQSMVSEQQEAERKKAASLEIQSSLEKQKQQIEERRTVVMADLAEAEPAVVEAQKSVSSIKKQHLTEVRSMTNPPSAVKMAMESVCVLLGHEIDSWKTVQQIIRKDDFIASIVNYDTDKNMTPNMREKMQREFLNNPDFNFDSVNRASKACGPLVQWVIAQVKFSAILDKVGPLRAEVEELETTAQDTETKALVMKQMIQELEESIAKYKDEYATLITETQQLKTEMEQVKSKVDRSLLLIENLSSEKSRWEFSSDDFDAQMKTIAGDALLASAYLAYSGFFDQEYRQMLLSKWTSYFDVLGIALRKDLSLAEYISTPDERLFWIENGLPKDDLCSENAVMLTNYRRYPLIIDPSDQAIEFLKNQYANSKIAVTSFLDASFIKIVESALRFGTAIIVKDVEYYDQILNGILNHEIRRAGGRVLLRLGTQDIDFSPNFKMFMVTRDPSFNFSPDISSRVTFVNFTVTKESLQNQCLSELLKSERPDIDQKRNDLLKLQGEYTVRLRTLEKKLLAALSESQGSILENETLINTLEVLKRESAEIDEKFKSAEDIMQEVNGITNVYIPLASICSSLFFSIDQMQFINHFYQFSLGFFKNIFSNVLRSEKLKDIIEPSKRLTTISREIFLQLYQQCARSLLHVDYPVLALLFARIKIPHLLSDDLELLLGLSHVSIDKNIITSLKDSAIATHITENGIKILAQLASSPESSGLVESILKSHKAEWLQFVQSPGNSVFKMPVFWQSKDSISDSLKTLIVAKAVKPETFIQRLKDDFLTKVLESPSIESVEEVDFRKVVMDECSPKTPIIFCSVPGYDASFKPEEIAQDLSMKLISLAMGSQEGFDLADKAIQSAASQGQWVLLKNTHLAASWLARLEKKIHTLNANKNFRLFLTMEISPKIPSTLLRCSRTFMYEPTPGLKGSMSSLLSGISDLKSCLPPVERSRLYFLTSWLHTITQERLRYSPIGWSKLIEFNDADHDCAHNVIDSWLDRIGKGRANISPDKIPWDAIRILLKESVYGGRIDNEFDQKILDSFVDTLFGSKSFEINYPLAVSNKETLISVPEGTKMNQFLNWVHKLDNIESPSWIGLPEDVDTLLSIKKGNSILSKVRRLCDTDDYALEIKDSDASTEVNAGIEAMKQTVNSWKISLPKSISEFKQSGDAAMMALLNHFKRERESFMLLLKIVKDNLDMVDLVLNGKEKHSNVTRSLVECFAKNLIPSDWKVYKISTTFTLANWFTDFEARLKQLEQLSQLKSFDSSLHVWMGGLIHPEPFVTATRQFFARKNNWSLEDLEISFDFSGKDGIMLQDVHIQSAIFHDDKFKLGSSKQTPMEIVSLKWSPKKPETDQLAKIPVYLNEDRVDLLFAVPLELSNDVLLEFYRRGFCFLLRPGDSRC